MKVIEFLMTKKKRIITAHYRNQFVWKSVDGNSMDKKSAHSQVESSGIKTIFLLEKNVKTEKPNCFSKHDAFHDN